MPALSKAINDAINEQINKEFYSAYLYLSMAAYAESQDFLGAAHWLRLQWEEELAHALKFVDHVGERGGAVALGAIDEPPAQFGSLAELFQQVLEHEEAVTDSIHKLYELATAEKDYASRTLLQWFVDEQLEEESSAQEIVSMLKLAGKDGAGMLMVDRQLASRAKAPDAAAE